MVSSPPSLKRSILVSFFLVLAVFSLLASAQNPGNGGNDNGNTAAPAPAPPPSRPTANPPPSNPPPSNPPPSNPPPSNPPPASRPSGGDDDGNDAAQTSTNQPSRPVTSAPSATRPSVPPTEPPAPPRLTTPSGPNPLDDTLPTDMPTLTNAPLIITYPPASVPPTKNAPFMQRSDLPDGTVFIAVGAILGAFGAAILIWRITISCLLHRSVERAAMAQHAANDKASFPAPPAPFYKYTDHESSLSLGAGVAGRGVRRTTRGPIPSATPSQSNLFFSPTAQGGAGGTGSNRDSRFLPSGFYAASSPSPAPAHGHSISLTNLRPDSRGQYGGVPSRNAMREPSPPDSPQFAARRDPSTSSLNLNLPPGQRAPSAYLEDLLDENPGAFPPQAPGPRHAHTYSQAVMKLNPNVVS